MITLDDRLAAAASLVRFGSRVADVGTDHGYLIASLLQKGQASYGYACDIHEMPLESARQTLQSCGLTEKATLLLGDGLNGISPEQVDDVVIAGMGGEMILHILDEAGWQDPRHRFILQPMTKVHELRAGLYGRGYEILQEKAASVGKFVYTVMQVRWSGEKKAVDELFARVGKLPESQEPEAALYLQRQRDTVRQIAENMEKSNTNSNKTKELYELADEIQRILSRKKEG